ncbi:MAG: UDP-N-acetylmuramoyl-L-alanyl-D-glutamate--2,6-diaminopimelate ligase [Bacillota bacterium]|nr:UDP-N-acetylmuramoyl-L-alanyl-D-glutamate--2,6-diaminopimelate ligase [Bacillota bacterium]
MKLSSILHSVKYDIICGTDNIEINNIQYDSRNVKSGDLFVAIEGFSTDGHKFIDKAIQNGAKAVVCRIVPDNHNTNCSIIKVDEPRKALAAAAANYYNNPAKSLKLIGITGTNGKTTSSLMVKSILENAGFKVGLVGTIANYIGDKEIQTNRTTPESLELQKLFRDMVEEKVDYCVMEVSSHSLELDRVYGLNFNQGVFTNLTQDHLDFHKTFENYYKAKLKLFKISSTSNINVDDEYGRKICKDLTADYVTYGMENRSDIYADNIIMHSKGIEFDLSYKNEKEHINLNIPGKYNISNALGSAAACLSEGLSLKIVKQGLEALKAVAGRSEIVTIDYNLGFDIIVDYAHTPDGLENILKTAREFTKGKLICVFGCGGDRDKTKRPIMGNLGTSMSDLAIITSDNPRSEDPGAIIKDIIAGVKHDNYIVVEDRKDAIKKAIETAKKDDVIVIAGKGHETYQVLKDKTIHFDEREIIKDIISNNLNETN